MFTLLGAIISGLYVGFRYNRREILYSFLVTLLPNILLQLLYFSDISKFIDTSTTVIFFISNVLITALFGMLGGVTSLIYRKWQTKKDDIEKKRLERKNNTYWVTRLFVSILLFFYVFTYAVPVFIPVKAANCSDKEQNSDTFIECYDPANTYKTSAKSVVGPAKRRMPLEGAGAYYEQYPDIPHEVIDNILLQCGSTTNCNVSEGVNTYKNNTNNIKVYDSIGIPSWQQTYPEADGYLSGLWRNTLGGIIELGKAFRKDPWSTTKAVGKGIYQYLDQQQIVTNPMYASVRFVQTFGKDLKSYYGGAAQNVMKGNIVQGVSDFINIPKFFNYLVNNNYSGGTKQLTKDIQNPNKISQWAAQVGVISYETAQAVQQGKYRYAVSRAAGEVTGNVVMYIATEGILAGVGKVSQTVKSMIYARDFENGNFVTKTGVKIKGSTAHILEQSEKRGIPQNAILKTLKEPTAIGPIKINPDTGRPSQLFISKDAAVAVNPVDGTIPTVFKPTGKRYNSYIKSFSK